MTHYYLLQAPSVASVQVERVHWLWPGRIPFGKLSVIDGDPGLGKSTILLDLAARTSTGSPFPDGSTPSEPVDVVLLSAEDGVADTIRPRLEAAQADLSRIHVLEAVRETEEESFRPPELPRDLERVRALVLETRARLLIVDPIMAFLAGSVDSHRDQDVRRVLYEISVLSAELGCATVLVRHLNKAGGSNPLYRGGGSIGIIGAARSGMIVAPDPSDDSRRILAVTKSNLAPEAPALAYRLVPDALRDVARVQWEGPTDHKARDLLHDDREASGALAEAMAFLADLLATGPIPVKEIQRRAREEGHEKRTLRRAREQLGVVPHKRGAPGSDEQRWEWALPEVPLPEGDHEVPEEYEGDHENKLAPSANTLEGANKKTRSPSAPSENLGHLRIPEPDLSATKPCSECGELTFGADGFCGACRDAVPTTLKQIAERLGGGS